MPTLQAYFFILVVLLSIAHIPAYGMSSGPVQDESIQDCDFQKVARVIDGDTFDLTDGTRIRLIGVDTPEVVDPRKDIQWFGKEASNKLREWIRDKTVCLKYDMDRTRDTGKYGRSLRYVWKYDNLAKSGPDEDFFINAELIKRGYGFAYTKYPFQYLDEFREYEKSAREKNLGLWDKTEQQKWQKDIEKNSLLARTCSEDVIICPEKALDHVGERRTVRFFVKKSHDSGKAVFLNSKNDFRDHDNFTAVIFSRDREKFPARPSDFYAGKTVDVTGKIKKYKGRAEIILKNRDQIRIVDSYP